MSIISDDEFFQNETPIKNIAQAKKETPVNAEDIDYDRNFENTIRPKTFDSYIGQSALKGNLKIATEAAKKKKHASGSFTILRTTRTW